MELPQAKVIVHKGDAYLGAPALECIFLSRSNAYLIEVLDYPGLDDCLTAYAYAARLFVERIYHPAGKIHVYATGFIGRIWIDYFSIFYIKVVQNIFSVVKLLQQIIFRSFS